MLTATPVGLYFAMRTPAPPPIPFSEFLQHVTSGRVAQVVFEERSLGVTMRDGTKNTTIAPPEFFSSNAGFVNELVRQNVRVEVSALPELCRYQCR